MIKTTLKKICPPIVFDLYRKLSKQTSFQEASVEVNTVGPSNNPSEQSLKMYWDEDYAKVLDMWGEDHVWKEIQIFLSQCKGKVLDIACGTGITIEILSKYKDLEVHGFDISDLLIEKAIEKNIPKERLKVLDATKTDYEDNEFDYSFSIGSLEHFTLTGIDEFIIESARYTKKVSFHMVPVSKSNKDEGWVTTIQSYFNNSEAWWMNKFKKQYSEVLCIPSKWEDHQSVGRWYMCIK